MSKLQELREKREQLRTQIETTRQTIAERRDNKEHKGVILTPEERTAFDKLSTDFKAVKTEIEAEEGAAAVERFLTDEVAAEERSRRGAGGRLDPTADDKLPGAGSTYGDALGTDRDAFRRHAQAEERRAMVLASWALAGDKNAVLTSEQRQAIHDSGVDLGGNVSIGTLPTEELRSLRAACQPYAREKRMQVADTILGRYAESRAVAGPTHRANLAPTVTTIALEKAIVTIGGLVNAADVIVTSDGTTMVWPTANDTSNEGKQINDTTAESLTGTAPTTGNFSLGSWEFWSDFIRMSNTVLRDTPTAFAAEIGAMIGERLGRVVNRRATNGVGTTTLRGIELGLTAGALMADADTFLWEDLYKLKYSIDAAYREVASWMMNDETYVALMLISDDNGRPVLIEPQDGSMPRLLQRPVVANNHMVGAGGAGTVAAGRPSLLFGDLKRYKLRLVSEVRMGRYVERFAEFDQTGFDGKRGADGGLLNAGTPPVKGLFVKP